MSLQPNPLEAGAAVTGRLVKEARTKPSQIDISLDEVVPLAVHMDSISRWPEKPNIDHLVEMIKRGEFSICGIPVHFLDKAA